MSDYAEAAHAAGTAMEQAVAVFMLHPQTFAESIAAGYTNPLTGYAAGRGGVLGESSGTTVAAIFAVFEPGLVCNMWEEGVAVRGATGAAEVYWGQAADFGRQYLAGADGLERIAALGEKIFAATPDAGLPLFAGWRRMPLADDAAARALQVMFVHRELRAGVHFNALTISGITPIEAHMLNKGHQYATMFGWPEPFADGADKADRYVEVEQATDRRMAEIYCAALEPAEADELARLSTAALATLKAGVPKG